MRFLHHHSPSRRAVNKFTNLGELIVFSKQVLPILLKHIMCTGCGDRDRKEILPPKKRY